MHAHYTYIHTAHTRIVHIHCCEEEPVEKQPEEGGFLLLTA
jgi:hypothetical protein